MAKKYSTTRRYAATHVLRSAIREWLLVHENDAPGLNAICEQELVRGGDPDAIESMTDDARAALTAGKEG